MAKENHQNVFWSFLVRSWCAPLLLKLMDKSNLAVRELSGIMPKTLDNAKGRFPKRKLNQTP